MAHSLAKSGRLVARLPVAYHARMTATDTITTSECPECGQANPQIAKFCSRCGRSFEKGAARPAAGADPTSVDDEDEVASVVGRVVGTVIFVVGSVIAVIVVLALVKALLRYLGN